MTSQTWRTAAEVDKPVWKHWLTVIKPAKVRHQKALLFITGGNNTNDAPKAADENLARVAVATGSVVAELRMVPSQPPSSRTRRGRSRRTASSAHLGQVPARRRR